MFIKKIKKVAVLLIIALTVTCIFPTSIKASENENQTFTIYNGDGEIVQVVHTQQEVDEFFSEIATRSNVFQKIISFFAILDTMNRIITRIDVVYRTVRWLQNESDFYDIIEVLTNEDFLRQMAISLKRGTIYAIDAFNPYPPHSYQGAMWKKQNAYLVVES